MNWKGERGLGTSNFLRSLFRGMLFRKAVKHFPGNGAMQSDPPSQKSIVTLFQDRLGQQKEVTKTHSSVNVSEEVDAAFMWKANVQVS